MKRFFLSWVLVLIFGWLLLWPAVMIANAQGLPSPPGATPKQIQAPFKVQPGAAGPTLPGLPGNVPGQAPSVGPTDAKSALKRAAETSNPYGSKSGEEPPTIYSFLYANMGGFVGSLQILALSLLLCMPVIVLVNKFLFETAGTKREIKATYEAALAEDAVLDEDIERLTLENLYLDRQHRIIDGMLTDKHEERAVYLLAKPASSPNAVKKA
jgi:hypothetical protein